MKNSEHETCDGSFCGKRSFLGIGPISFCQLFLVVIFVLFAIASAHAQYNLDDPKFKGKIDLKPELGTVIPSEIPVVNAKGDTVTLGSVLGNDLPVIFVLHYSDCPMLCGLVLNGISEATQNVGLVAGKQYRIVAVSIDPLETPQRSRGSEKRFNGELPKGSLPGAWRFLTAPQASIDSLTNSLGFVYFYDKKNKQYAHPAAIFLLTPEHKLSRVLYGIQFNPRDVKLGLLEAGREVIGDPVDKLILYCFHYDPDSQSYVVFASNVMKIGGVITMGLLALLIGGLWLRERKKANKTESKT
jgi:protein SCO1